MHQQEVLASNIAAVRGQIAEAAQRVGRRPEEIISVAVSKTKPLDLVQMAYELGITHFGENRVQEALSKIATWNPSDVHWHMIGHLQTNKVGKVVGQFDCIHSIDSLHLAETLNRHVASFKPTGGQRQLVLLQVNISGETSKEGIEPDMVISLTRQITTLEHLEIQGLMTIAPLVDNPEKARPVFRALRELRDRLQNEVPECSWQHLSMGMTDDYQVAIEEGATIVRIGRAIFGERIKKGTSQ
ncbi:MAG TPA: YggS family pyridoxal phosphate-dependent enzyme [Ktedonobacteraceae bacterium]|nr:YggS family pyridoxal phosphate-dependent enzyme [Ktedonobacteraceae bacterium]